MELTSWSSVWESSLRASTEDFRMKLSRRIGAELGGLPLQNLGGELFLT